MWQRIQTLYFAIITGILLALVFGNVGVDYSDPATIEGVRYISKLPYAILIFISLAANVSEIFFLPLRKFDGYGDTGITRP